MTFRNEMTFYVWKNENVPASAGCAPAAVWVISVISLEVLVCVSDSVCWRAHRNLSLSLPSASQNGLLQLFRSSCSERHHSVRLQWPPGRFVEQNYWGCSGSASPPLFLDLPPSWDAVHRLSQPGRVRRLPQTERRCGSDDGGSRTPHQNLQER